MSEVFFMWFPVVLMLGAMVFVGTIVAVYVRGMKERQRQFLEWAATRNYHPIRLDTSILPARVKKYSFTRDIDGYTLRAGDYIQGSSFNAGSLQNGFTGTLEHSKNTFSFFLQNEERGSGKNRRVYKRTVLKVEIPDTKIQMIINSKINNDHSSGGNINRYAKNQRYELEGDFGTFFEVFMPPTTQSETLSVLTPDSMLYVMVNLADYDIEINGTNLFLYTYRHLKLEEFDGIISKLDGFLEEARLRKHDTRSSRHDDVLVARTAAHVAGGKRDLRKDFRIVGILLPIGIVLVQFESARRGSPLLSIAFYAIFGLFAVRTAADLYRNHRLKKKYEQVIGSYKAR